MWVNSPAPGFDDPLGLLCACHGRIRERLETLERLPAHLESHGCDKDACEAVERILAYFDKAAPHHHADEEDLFPLLLACSDRPGWEAGLEEWIGRLLEEHPILEQGWAELRIVLRALAAGDPTAVPEAADWVSATRAHLALEEDCVFPLAARLLGPEELGRLGRAMATRRGVAPDLGQP